MVDGMWVTDNLRASGDPQYFQFKRYGKNKNRICAWSIPMESGFRKPMLPEVNPEMSEVEIDFQGRYRSVVNVYTQVRFLQDGFLRDVESSILSGSKFFVVFLAGEGKVISFRRVPKIGDEYAGDWMTDQKSTCEYFHFMIEEDKLSAYKTRGRGTAPVGTRLFRVSEIPQPGYTYFCEVTVAEGIVKGRICARNFSSLTIQVDDEKIQLLRIPFSSTHPLEETTSSYVPLRPSLTFPNMSSCRGIWISDNFRDEKPEYFFFECLEFSISKRNKKLKRVCRLRLRSIERKVSDSLDEIHFNERAEIDFVWLSEYYEFRPFFMWLFEMKRKENETETRGLAVVQESFIFTLPPDECNFRKIVEKGSEYDGDFQVTSRKLFNNNSIYVHVRCANGRLFANTKTSWILRTKEIPNLDDVVQCEVNCNVFHESAQLVFRSFSIFELRVDSHKCIFSRVACKLVRTGSFIPVRPSFYPCMYF